MGNPRTCIIFITIQLLSMLAAQEFSKRVPQGFFGVRGKKYYLDENEHYYKRKPQFFVGVKGKKDFSDSLQTSEEYYKRAPTGFLGMRGKKYDPDNLYSNELNKKDGSLIGQIDYTSGESTANADNPVLTDILLAYLLKQAQYDSAIKDDLEAENSIAKRAPNVHQFFGVRGKKSVDDKRSYDLSFRGKFIGVRGKKDVKDSGAREIKFLLNNEPLKRQSQLGFLGMRGKKWIDANRPYGDVGHELSDDTSTEQLPF